MIVTAARRIAVGAVPAFLLTGALAGCGSSAPGVAAPTVSSTASPTTTTPTAPVSTQSGVPTVSAAPTTATADPTKVCTTNDTYSTPAALAPSTKKAAWGQPLDVSQKYGGQVAMTGAAPVAKTPAADDIFGPQKGQVYLLVKVTVTYKSGSNSVFGSTDFTLRDAGSNVCDSNLISSVVPQNEQFRVITIGDAKTKTYTGTLVFEAPEGQDYSKYALLYRADTFSNKTGDATVAWTS